MSQPAPLAVYIHWPYCARICPYCDFNVVRDRRQAEQADLALSIIHDLEGQAALMAPRRLSSIFLGGGTPSLMDPAWAADIITAACRLWPSDGPVEITLEANPTDAEASRFARFAEAGVQRLSLGVQSLEDRALKFLGRNHAAAEAVRAIGLGQKAFPRVSVDLIYALPDQSPEAWAAELRAVADFGVEHISPYQLTIEAGTAFDRLVRRGAFTPPDEDRAFALYRTTQEALEARGYEAYEVSNHARGQQGRSVHNLAYWRGWDYVGAGPGAHGRLTLDGGRAATHAETRVADYRVRVAKTGTGVRQWERLSARDAAIERLLLGLRSVEGVPVADLAGLDLNQDHAALFAKEGLIALDNHRITATAAGRAVLDRLTAELIA